MTVTQRLGASRPFIVLTSASLAVLFALGGCKDKDEGDDDGRGGTAGSGGATTGGAVSTGGTERGGEGGEPGATGGAAPTGGAVGDSGGTQPTGGLEETGGTAGTPVTGGTAGAPVTGGAAGASAAAGSAGAPLLGGAAGTPTAGGAAGQPATGGAAGAPPSTNECALGLDTCGASAACVDEPIGYRCECLAGYSGDGVECTDVDECETGADACAADAACTNTPGGYTCACAAGFAGDGVTCADLDECETGADDCSADATCTNLPGSYACACNAGFTGDGVTCADVDECDLGTDNCSEDATCANTAGSFTCTCDPGFAGNGVICSASCGDGLTTDPEECDDANEQAADGCSTCVLDPGFRCVGTPSVCASVCGDGLVVGDEDCDDGNSAELDGCTTACALECGDGAVNGLEAVTIEYLAADCFGLLLAVNGRDPIALPPGGCEDLCSPTIQTVEVTEPAFLSSFRHGDNTLAVTSYLTTLFGEEVYDYICAVEPQFCTYVGWVTLTARYRDIGSELVVAYDYEDGEDAELRNPDLCDAGAGIDAASTFPLPFIGVAGETCDDGNRESADGCSATCATECGNGVIDDAEQCDDGNGVSGDGCSASCFVEEMWSCRLQPSQCEIRPEYLTCQDRCGDLFGGACWCAPPCTEFGNCCDDFAEICGGDV